MAQVVGSNHRKCVKHARLACPDRNHHKDDGRLHDVQAGLVVSSQPGEAAVLGLGGGPAVEDGLHDVAVELVPQLGQS